MAGFTFHMAKRCYVTVMLEINSAVELGVSSACCPSISLARDDTAAKKDSIVYVSGAK